MPTFERAAKEKKKKQLVEPLTLTISLLLRNESSTAPQVRA
jgi:hypothetical protein